MHPFAPPGPHFETAVVCVELPPPPSLLPLAQSLWHRPHPWLLESTLAVPPLGRWSFAGADPYLVLRCSGRQAQLEVRRAVRPDLATGRRTAHAHPLEALRGCLPPAPRTSPPHTPPFCGGAVGVFAYELAGSLERLPAPPAVGLPLPDLAFLFVDRLLAYDQLDRRLFACGLGFGADSCEARARAEAAAREVAEQVEGAGAAARAGLPADGRRPSLDELERRAASVSLERFFDASSYAKTVERILEEIRAGNVYQACLTQRLDVRHRGSALELHRRLRELSPAPFAA